MNIDLNGDKDCPCTECFTNFLVTALDGPIALMVSFGYRYSQAKCPDCSKGTTECPKGIYHGESCKYGRMH